MENGKWDTEGFWNDFIYRLGKMSMGKLYYLIVYIYIYIYTEGTVGLHKSCYAVI